MWPGNFVTLMKGLLFLFPDGGGQAYPLRVEMLRCDLGIFATQKASGISNPRWPQSVEKPRVGRRSPQTALRWFAGKVLRHKG